MNLFSERLCYKKITIADFPVYLNMATNKDVMKYITGKALAIKEAEERFEIMIDTNNKISEIGFYLVNEKQTGHFVGLGKLVFIEDNTAEIGYSLLPQYWGKKYASEIAGFFIGRARFFPYIKNLVALVNPDNIASKKLLTKHGFAWLETGFVNELPTEIHKLIIRPS